MLTPAVCCTALALPWQELKPLQGNASNPALQAGQWSQLCVTCRVSKQGAMVRELLQALRCRVGSSPRASLECSRAAQRRRTPRQPGPLSLGSPSSGVASKKRTTAVQDPSAATPLSMLLASPSPPLPPLTLSPTPHRGLRLFARAARSTAQCATAAWSSLTITARGSPTAWAR